MNRKRQAKLLGIVLICAAILFSFRVVGAGRERDRIESV